MRSSCASLDTARPGGQAFTLVTDKKRPLRQKTQRPYRESERRLLYMEMRCLQSMLGAQLFDVLFQLGIACVVHRVQMLT